MCYQQVMPGGADNGVQTRYMCKHTSVEVPGCASAMDMARAAASSGSSSSSIATSAAVLARTASAAACGACSCTAKADAGKPTHRLIQSDVAQRPNHKIQFLDQLLMGQQ